jgi:hypothetical protein
MSEVSNRWARSPDRAHSRRRSGDLAEQVRSMGEGLPTKPSAAVRRPGRTSPLDGRGSPDRAHSRRRSGDLAEQVRSMGEGLLAEPIPGGGRRPGRTSPLGGRGLPTEPTRRRSGDLAERVLPMGEVSRPSPFLAAVRRPGRTAPPMGSVERMSRSSRSMAKASALQARSHVPIVIPMDHYRIGVV